MTPPIALLLAILVCALVLFTFEWVSADVVALGLLLTLSLTGLVPADQAFAGFGSDTVIFLLGLLILTAALVRTGVVASAGRLLLRRTGENPSRILTLVMAAAALLSAFVSNTAATAFFLPVVVGLAQRARVSAAKLLMPLAFAAILTSSVTLISTSTNVLVSGLMTQHGQPPMGMFELAPVGLPIAVVGLAYMLLVGTRLVPDRTPAEHDGDLGLRRYLTEVFVLPESPLIGKTLGESNLGRDLDLTVVQVVRDKHRYFAPRSDLKLQERDVLLVEGLRDEILKVKDTAGIDIKADVKLGDPELEGEQARLVEAILLPGSQLISRTLKGFRFRERFGPQVLAIHRHPRTLHRKISQIVLRMGDVLLVQGRHEAIAALDDRNVLRVLGPVEGSRPNVQRAPIAIGIFAAALLAATFNLLSLPVAMLLGVLAAFLTRCITPEEAYREIEWKALIVIASMLALGAAMTHTGAAEFLAGQFVGLVGGAHPAWLLTAFFALTVLLTQPMSNQAAAVVVLPVALQTAVQLGLNPRTFAMMIAVAASCSYMTPLEPACLMVYGPGRYRFRDFLKVGTPLTLLIYVIAILLVPLVWPL
jgi:di/tricarboxylate transporter